MTLPDIIDLNEIFAKTIFSEKLMHQWPDLTWIARQYQASKTSEIESMDKLIQWLPENEPRPVVPETKVVHGDFRVDNLVFDEKDPTKVLATDLIFFVSFLWIFLPGG